MYYEEKVINGVLMCRTTPSGEWRQCSIEKIGEYMVELQKLRELVAQQQWPDEDDPRQQAIEQNGNDGAVYPYMPKVGEECEVLNVESLHNPKWEKCEILFIGKFKVVYNSESCKERIGNVDIVGACKFRPLRTERELFIKAGELLDSNKIETAEDFLGALYDAGFKAPEVSE